MPVTAVLCPQPPLLLPQTTGGRVPDEVEQLREACRAAVAALLAPAPARVAVVGPGTHTQLHARPPSAAAALGGFGVPVGHGDDGAGVPLSLAIGSRLLDDAGAAAETAWFELDPQEKPEECRRLGAELATSYDALLALGDGSTRRGFEPPGGADARAEAFDAAVAAALEEADDVALCGVDPGLAADLGAAGRVAWQVLAGWAEQRTTRGRLLYAAAPFGVGYVVATWSTPARPA